MSKSDTDYDVVIVGGGVVGCASAYHLAPDHDVAVLEKGQIAGEASGLAAGLVAPTLFYSDHPTVARYANSWFRELDGTGNFTFQERPRVEFIQSDSEADARARSTRLSNEGFPVSFLEPAAIETKYPWFDASEFAGAVEYRDTGWVDPYEYTVTLREAAEERGVDVYTGQTVETLQEEGDAVTGVDTADGTVEADHVVIAAGWRTPDLLSKYVTMPVRPFRLQCAVLRPEESLSEDFPLGRIAREELYFRGEANGDLLVGGGEYLENDPDAVVPSVSTDEDFRRHVARIVPTFFDPVDGLEFVDGWAGVDGATPDTFPILDSPPQVPDGLVVATGFNGLGMVSSPVAAESVRSLVTGEEPSFPLAPFALERFPSDDVTFDLQGTFEMAGAGR